MCRMASLACLEFDKLPRKGGKNVEQWLKGRNDSGGKQTDKI